MRAGIDGVSPIVGDILLESASLLPFAVLAVICPSIPNSKAP